MGSGYGFICYANSPDAFWDSIKGAREIFEQKDVWPMLMERAISRDFSWQMVAERYERVYEQLGLKAVGLRRSLRASKLSQPFPGTHEIGGGLDVVGMRRS